MGCIKMYTASCQDSIEWDLTTALSAQFPFNLQLFSQEKTEDATPKKKEEARKKGQVAKSVEINSAFVILSAFIALKVAGPYMYDEMANFMRQTFSYFATADITVQDTYILFLNFTMIFLKTTMPVMIAIFIISLAVNFLQVGFVLSFESLMPQIDRIDPISGFKRLFSLRSIMELFKALSKIVIISYFVYRFIGQETARIPEFITSDLSNTLVQTSSMIFSLAVQIGAVLLVLAAIDYFYQWWEHTKSLKMSKEEVKEEYKQTEGNPQIKGKIKERQRAMAMRRMMQEIPTASAVITNPTHYAVAIKYDRTMSAPTVVAKGQDFLAERIKTIARENGVAIVENKLLARALYASVEIGDSIPSELYQAVAEVLAYVFRLKKRLS